MSNEFLKACEKGNLELVRQFLAKGIDINNKDILMQKYS